ncbi:hypothetical protein MBLNU457_3251t2 [Dothideomycetes sp. NU457]
MAEAITIPSPSAFLRSSPPSDPKDKQPPSEAQKHARKKSVTASRKKAAANNVDKTKPKTNDVNRPKQSKSRNATDENNDAQAAPEAQKLGHINVEARKSPISAADGDRTRSSHESISPRPQGNLLDPLLASTGTSIAGSGHDGVLQSREDAFEVAPNLFELSSSTHLSPNILAPTSGSENMFQFPSVPQGPADIDLPVISHSPPILTNAFTALQLPDDSPEDCMQPEFTASDHSPHDPYEQWMLTRDTLPPDLHLFEDLVSGDVFSTHSSPEPEDMNLIPGSQEIIASRFDRFTCGILSVKDGPNENPWRTLIWPMTETSPALLNAMSAMSAFHSSRDMPHLRVVGQQHNILSLQYLGEGINDGSMRLDTAIATCLALGFAQSWDLPTSSGNQHIRGARSLIHIALKLHIEQPLDGDNLARLKFLCNAYLYMDVIARITSIDSDETDDYETVFRAFNGPNDQGFGIDFGLSIDTQLDPLMGCASTLFPLIGRTANLVRRVRRCSSNNPPIISSAMELKLLLQSWEPPEFIQPPEDPSSTVEHSIQTAEAYRWATLLYLHQAVDEIPSPSSQEIADKVLCYLATVPLASRFVIVHIFPLMAAGCEASTDETRAWVKERWTAMSNRLRIGAIDRCLEITEEVWRRRDCRDVRPFTLRSLVSTADLHGSTFSTQIHMTRPDPFSPTGDVESNPFETPQMGHPPFLRRHTVGTGLNVQPPAHRNSFQSSRPGKMDPELTVRGSLHWLGVMRDLNWEVLLG